MDQNSARTDITVNVEGLWLLQALLDIRHVAPELRCRPFVSITENNDWLKEHPGLAIMREQGIVVDDTVNEEVADRLKVLAVPDIEVVALLSHGKLRYGVSQEAIEQYEASERDGEQAQQPVEGESVGSRDIPDNEFRVVLARRDEHWVSAVRVGTDITIDDVSVTDAASIAALVTAALESINHADPAAITAVNVPLEEMLSATKTWQTSGFNVFSSGDLRRMGLTAATIAALGQALSEPAAEAAVYARQYRDDARESSASVLSLKDSSAGRIAMYQQARTVGSGQKWLAICPATPQLVQVGVQTVLDTVPFGAWRTHRRV
ncbi:ESX secretion-associated protein EspG [Mycobacterium sp. 1274756.6]|uniref:ESX secretion-associated protein EspG n=1 Tax=Mycobacterium sp. 1274756.6 TaxID=1834076 RepID=UPI0007FC4E9F|nr:ESX secretion-associated protein EspG [Mycobacterium sp. 1274756.6]OBJ71903.1 hypothetical protein A5643_06845 [Mycobacterium sp. 1274756.6]